MYSWWIRCKHKTWRYLGIISTLSVKTIYLNKVIVYRKTWPGWGVTIIWKRRGTPGYTQCQYSTWKTEYTILWRLHWQFKEETRSAKSWQTKRQTLRRNFPFFSFFLSEVLVERWWLEPGVTKETVEKPITIHQNRGNWFETQSNVISAKWYYSYYLYPFHI